MQIWLKGLSERKNTMALFLAEIKKAQGKFIMNLSGASAFRLFVNGKITGYGPRRINDGYSAINSYDLT